jgi:hypothetical protein
MKAGQHGWEIKLACRLGNRNDDANLRIDLLDSAVDFELFRTRTIRARERDPYQYNLANVLFRFSLVPGASETCCRHNC